MKNKHFLPTLLVISMIALLLVLPGCTQSQPQPGPAPAPASTPEQPSNSGGAASVSTEPFTLLFAGVSPGGTGDWALVGAGVAECLRLEGGVVTLTPGEGTSNPITVYNKQAEIAFAQNVVTNAAINGIEPYDAPMPGLKAIASLYSSAAQLIVQKGSPIQSFNQIRDNKMAVRIAVDEVGSTQELSIRRMMGEYGITYDDIKSWGGQIVYKGFGEGAELMAENRVDMLWLLTAAPSASAIELASNRDLRMIDISDVASQMTEKYGYQPYTIESDAYDFLDQDMVSFATQVLIIVHEDMEDEIAYRIVKALDENVEYLRTVLSRLNTLDLDRMSKPIGVELHPGAQRYYEEKGAL